ncbi:NUDIX domain-containing protein [Microbacterium sp.]|uniref:NUDIX hydrolase n=1 Tax=Microbacterium sp. TaxID=51671 RepID=UPI002733DE69|nr:NUDIX domain-containing protein [Microbacterium sp.]MDP3952447.1 NUDIX domain-containing protein [Microbacterium sp.]
MTDRPHEEMVSVYDENGQLTGTARRSAVREHNLRHACAVVVVLNFSGEIYLHRRAETKDLYPGCYDVMAGGVLHVGEDPLDGAMREVEEELGVTGVVLEPLGEADYSDDDARFHAFGYLAEYDGPIRWQPEEVVWGAWVTIDRLLSMVADPECSFAPDTLALMDSWMDAIRLRL